MKKSLRLINLALLAAILSSMVFQTVHSFDHMVEAYWEKHCIHKIDHGKAQLTHEHRHLDHCFTCEFSIGNFVAPQIFSFVYFTSSPRVPYFRPVGETPSFFSGHALQLRGPPASIV